MQIIVENCQEIFDSVIMSYRLAEDYDIQLPVMLNYDGYYLSFLAEGVEIPGQEDGGPIPGAAEGSQPRRTVLEPGSSLGCGSHGMGVGVC